MKQKEWPGTVDEGVAARAVRRARHGWSPALLQRNRGYTPHMPQLQNDLPPLACTASVTRRQPDLCLAL